jgi:putative oxidoreductase
MIKGMKNLILKLINYRYPASWSAYGPALLRTIVAIIFIAHGWQKIDNGVSSFAATLVKLGVPFPDFFAVLVTALEFGGGILLLLGVWTFWISNFLAINMVVAIITVHWKNGFFSQKGGYEFTLLLLVCCIVISLLGPGKPTLFSRK